MMAKKTSPKGAPQEFDDSIDSHQLSHLKESMRSLIVGEKGKSKFSLAGASHTT